MNDELKPCSNCKRDITVANYDIHFAHCCRNIEICQKCLEPFPRKEIERHIKEAHAVVPCERCEKHMERWEISDHKESCTKRPISCLYCELNVPWDEIKDHEAYCGSRTKQCQNCKKYVMIKEEEKHVKDCLDHMMVDEARRTFGNRTSSHLLKRTYDNRKSQLEKETNLSLNIPLSDTSKLTSEHTNKQQLSGTGESSGVNVYQHVRKYAFGDSETESDDDAVASVRDSFSKLSTCDDLPSSNSLLLKKKINEMSHSNISSLHPQKKTTTNMSADFSLDSNIIPRTSLCEANNNMQNPSDEPASQNIHNIVGETAIPYDKPVAEADIRTKAALQLPSSCPLCKKEFPVSMLESHVVHCDFQTLPCPICGLEMRLRDRDNHINMCKQVYEQSESTILQAQNSRHNRFTESSVLSCTQGNSAGSCSSFSGNQTALGAENPKKTKHKKFGAGNYKYNAAEPVMLPCEFCGKQILDYNLIVHQSGCKPELFSYVEASDIHSDPVTKPSYSAVVKDESTVLQNVCPDDESKDKKIMVSGHDSAESPATSTYKRNKRGRSGSGYYTLGSQAIPGEFLPNMAYAGFPDCYKIYEAQRPGVAYFGNPGFSLYPNPAVSPDVYSMQSYAKSGTYAERNYKEEKPSQQRKFMSLGQKEKLSVQGEESDSDSIYESCGSNSGSESRKQGTQKKRISSKKEQHSPKKEKSSHHATPHKKSSSKKKPRKDKKLHKRK